MYTYDTARNRETCTGKAKSQVHLTFYIGLYHISVQMSRGKNVAWGTKFLVDFWQKTVYNVIMRSMPFICLDEFWRCLLWRL